MTPKARGTVDGLILALGLMVLSFGAVYPAKDGSTLAYLAIAIGAAITAVGIGRAIAFVAPRFRKVRAAQRRGSNPNDAAGLGKRRP